MEGVFSKKDELNIPYLIEGEDGNEYNVKMNDIPASFFENIKGKKKRWDLYYLDSDLNKCFLLEFDIVDDSRLGKIAKNIVETTRLLNNETGEFEIMVTDLVFDHYSVSYYDNHPNFGAIAREYSSEVLLFYRKIGGYGKGVVDIRSQILKANDRKKITHSLVERMKEKLVGKRLTVVRACPCHPFSGEISDVVFMGTTHKHSPIQLLVSLDQVNKKNTETLMIKDDDLTIL